MSDLDELLLQLASQKGQQITITQRNGVEIAGLLVDAGANHVTIKVGERRKTILLEMIGAWEVLESNGITPLATPSKNLTGEPSGFEEQIQGRLSHIEGAVTGKIEGSHIQMPVPDFKLPPEELRGSLNKDVASEWQRIKQKYDYAAQINELGSRYGRILPIINSLKTLIEQVPRSPSLKRHLAYFQFVAGLPRESLQSYKEASLLSGLPGDWYSVAALALAMKPQSEDVLACYALHNVFQQASLNDYLEGWYLYVHLLHTLGNMALLREIAEKRASLLTETEVDHLCYAAIYLLRQVSKDQLARTLVSSLLMHKPVREVLRDALHGLDDLINTSYQRMQEEFALQHKPQEAPDQPAHSVTSPPQARVYTFQSTGQDLQGRATANSLLNGRIFSYHQGQLSGSIRGADGNIYYFHRSAIMEGDLLQQLEELRQVTLSPEKEIGVVFSSRDGAQGRMASNITRLRTTEDIFALATSYYKVGAYAKALTQIKRVLESRPEYPGAQELAEKCRQRARERALPHGTTPYALAQRTQIMQRDLERAASLYYEAIQQKDRVSSAVMDLAALLMSQLKRPAEAIQVLLEHRYEVIDQRAVDHLLSSAYQKAGQYGEAIALLQKELETLGSGVPRTKQAHVRKEIATCYLKQNNFAKAEAGFREVIKLQPADTTAKRSLAVCIIKQERYEEAERLLNTNLSDPQSVELLGVVSQARATGQAPQIDTIAIQADEAEDWSGLSEFAVFYLERCDYEGVPAIRKQQQRFELNDAYQLEELARKMGTRTPLERAQYYLSAAKILVKIKNRGRLYKYLCRSFTSRGDAAVISRQPLDTAREWYCQALMAYDGESSMDLTGGERRIEEQDAVNGLVRSLWAAIGRTAIPFKEGGHENLSIDEGLKDTLDAEEHRTAVLDTIAYLVSRSPEYAAKRILPRLYDNPFFQREALAYLKHHQVVVPEGLVRWEEFEDLWKRLRLDHLQQARVATNLLNSIARVEFSGASVEESLRNLQRVEQMLSFEVERERAVQLRNILESMLDICKEVDFQRREGLCKQIATNCKQLLDGIVENPTRLSVEGLYDTIKTIEEKTADHLNNLYASSVPQLTLRLPEDMGSYAPDASNQEIQVQIVIGNMVGCSPAEGVELVVEEDGRFFKALDQEMKQIAFLQGGDQRIVKVPLRVTEQARQAQAFSLPVSVRYHTRSKDLQQTPAVRLSINLYPAEQFELIDPNPYAPYAKGGPVGDKKMFYGRDVLIENIAKAIYQGRGEGKSIIIYGQMRSGKTSILVHLKERLREYQNLVVADVGSIGAFLDEKSPTPLLYQLLEAILLRIEYALEDEVEKRGRPPLDLVFPDESDFYAHATPLMYFITLLTRFKRAASRTPGWEDVHLVLFIDEFSYLYGQIMNKRLSEDFMRNWKALLQEKFFSVVLAGHDAMPKFKKSFSNEFAATEEQRVNYLSEKDARALIDQPIRMGEKADRSRYRERAIEHILDLSAGSPFYIQIICDRLVKHMNVERMQLVTEANVEEVKNQLIQGENSLDWDTFQNLTSSGDDSPDAIPEADAQAVLKVIALQSRTGPCSRASIKADTKTNIDTVLLDLETREVLAKKEGQFYTIRVGLFREWLVAHQ